jgi:hypothetical protein
MTNDRTTLVLWWERDAQQRRQAMQKQYPLPYDGASNVVMSNFFAVVGFGDERIGHKERLGALLYLTRPVMVEKFLELWPKIPPTLPVGKEKTDEPSSED